MSLPVQHPGRNHPDWAHFRHVADIGVRGLGNSPAQAFEQAALALTAVITDPSAIHVQETLDLECEAPDLELLLVDWLNAVVYAMATRKMVFGAFSVHIEGLRLWGRAGGEPIDVARHQPAAEVKGVTLSELRVGHQPDGRWIAQCVVDV